MNDKYASSRVAIYFSLVYPSLFTWVYFDLLADSPRNLQQIVFLLGKALQFGFPVFYVSRMRGESIQLQLPTSRGIFLGAVSGILILAVMLFFYHGVMKGGKDFQTLADSVAIKVQAFGIGSTGKYFLLGVFYVTTHSFLEEYYWRWFLFARLLQSKRRLLAITISCIGFMAHHVILLGHYFGWDSPFTYLFSICVAIGGAFWAWLYHYTQSLYPAWLSHAIVDMAIFLVGYDIVYAALD